MKEVAEAVEVERQRHAMTRRDGLAREAQLEVNFDYLSHSTACFRMD